MGALVAGGQQRRSRGAVVDIMAGGRCGLGFKATWVDGRGASLQGSLS
jgi:hypothetical protein